MECIPFTYLQHNLLEALCLIMAAVLLQLLWPLLSRTNSGRLTLRRWMGILLRSMLSFGAYVLLGASLRHIRTPQLTETEKSALPTAGDFYGSTPLSQRAALISDNREALDLRLRMIRDAEASIILSTFSIHGDDSGMDLCAALLDAADRGVQVGILTDGYDAMTDNDGKLPFTALAAHPNINFHVYAPGSVLCPGKAMARMHEKYLICDGKQLLLGGRNCHDYFLGDYPAKLHNLDLDILLVGSGGVIDQLTAQYRDILALPDTVPLKSGKDSAAIETCYTELRSHAKETLPDLPPFDYDGRTVPCNAVTLIASSIEPAPKKPTLWHTLCTLMEAADREVLVHTPYLICSRSMKSDLTRIAQKTDLRITLNNPDTSANLFGSAVYLNDKSNLLATGAEILEYYGSRSSHTKALCIDERLAIVGSFNIDMRTTYIDSELMLAIDSPALARQLKAFMEAVELYASPAEVPLDLPTAPMRDLFVSLMRLIERPFRHLL